MPYEWLPSDDDQQRLRLWPHRSLTRAGFAGFVGATAALIVLPVLVSLGSAVAWVLMAFALVALAGLWSALRASERRMEIVEVLALTAERLKLDRHGPAGRRQSFEANLHWVEVTLYPSAGPVPNYLTLRGAGREVELGAFLSEEERLALCGELRAALRLRR